MKKIATMVKAAVAASAMLVAGPAMASTVINLGGSSSNGTDGNSRTSSADGTDVTVTGWAVTGSGNIEDGAVGRWSSGVGVQNSDTDNSHTIDNVGWTDFIVLQFSTAVTLESIQFNTGWYDNNGNPIYDTDATIGFANLAGGGLGWDGMNSSDVFSAFTFYDSNSMGNGSQSRLVNPLEYSANTWIVAASFSNTDGIWDGFKVGSVTFTAGAVPEPATWLMLMLGFGAIGAFMRRENRQLRMAYS